VESPLLITKFHVPKAALETIPRPRLMEKLNAGVSRKLTVISAPAGFGKTTLLSEWVAGSRRPVAWLSLDVNDNDPVQFWTYFVGAVQRLESRVGEGAFNMLRTLPDPPIRSVLTSLLNEIADKLPEFLFLLDDYHLISARPINDDLSFLIEHLPPNMHLVIAGRADPPLPLSRLRANAQLTELRADDLRFTPEEAEELFRRLVVKGLGQEDISALMARTEGWIAGLQMAALSMKGRGDRSRFIASFSGSNRYVLDYLADEVLNRQEEEVQSFLLQTSVLDRLNGALCDAVTGRTDGQQMLERLEAANLFVTPLDDERRWYRYHQLFADLLRSQLRKTHPELSAALYLRACAWFEKNGLEAEAIQYALAGNDPERAAKLSESVAVEMVAQNRAATVLEWVSRLPGPVLDRHPKLCAAAAWASLALRRVADVEKFMLRAGAQIPATATNRVDPEEGNIRFHLLTLRAFLARFRGDFAGSIELSLKAAEFAPYADEIVLGTATLNLGISYWNNGDLRAGAECLARAAQQAREADNYYCALTAIGARAELESQLGHLKKAAAICENAIELGKGWGGGDPFPTTGYAFVALSQILREWNRLDDAEATLLQGIRLGEMTVEPELMVRANLSLARLKQARGDFEAAAGAFRKAYAVEPVFACLKNQISLWEAQSWLSQGRLEEAARWAGRQEPQPNCAAQDDFAWGRYLTVARVKLAAGEAQDVLPPLESWRIRLEALARTSGVIEALTLQSLALSQVGRTDEALAALEQALRLAEPEGYVRTFIDLGMPMQQLLRQAARKRVAPDYVRALLKAFEPEAPQATSDTGTLNEQEKSILRLMSTGLSNKEISRELYLSLNTVKWYSSQIYSKLGVGSRAEAVNRARDLNIL